MALRLAMTMATMILTQAGDVCPAGSDSCPPSPKVGAGGSTGSTFLQFASRTRANTALSCAKFSEWPDVDEGKTCGNCQALVLTKNFDRCDRYCESFGHRCVAAGEERAESCDVEEEKDCDEVIADTTDMLCTCQRVTGEDCYGHLTGVARREGGAVGTVATASLSECQAACNGQASCKSFAFCPEWNNCFLKDRSLAGDEATKDIGTCKTYFKTSCGTTTAGATTTTTTAAATTLATTTGDTGDLCYAHFDGVARSEGQGLGMVETTELEKCQAACNDKEGCRSFARCPRWGKCFLKDRSFTGTESSRSNGDCKTFYQISCSLTTTTTTTTRAPGSGGDVVKVVSYNLYWWNAFQKNSWKSDGIIDNIKSTLRPDALGLQECDSPSEVRSRTNQAVERASDFKGAQGVMVKSGLFSTSNSGSRDLDATGKWGPRYVTWVKLTDDSGRAFWHFNTHWCVHSEGSRVCNEDVRYRGARNMLRAIEENAKDDPVVITGDFNANMNEKGIRHFLDNGFKLAVESWVDAIFYSKHWDLLDTGKGDRAGSDHRPVWAELSLK